MIVPISDKLKIKPICGKLIKTIENNRRPCLRPEGHDGGCNPFSNTPPNIPTKQNK